MREVDNITFWLSKIFNPDELLLSDDGSVVRVRDMIESIKQNPEISEDLLTALGDLTDRVISEQRAWSAVPTLLDGNRNLGLGGGMVPKLPNLDQIENRVDRFEDGERVKINARFGIWHRG